MFGIIKLFPQRIKLSLILKPGGFFFFLHKHKDGKGTKQKKNINIFVLRHQYMFGTLSVIFKRIWSFRVDRSVLQFYFKVLCE